MACPDRGRTGRGEEDYAGDTGERYACQTTE